MHMYDLLHNNSERVFARHGDDECRSEEGGAACYFQEAPKGSGYPLPSSTSIDFEINDVRDADSDPLTWYYTIGLRLSVNYKNPLASVYNMRIANGFPYVQEYQTNTGPINGDVYFSINVYWAPTTNPSVFWQTISTPIDMEMFRVQMHRHEYDKVFDSIYYVLAEPEELG
eukprot:UN32588